MLRKGDALMTSNNPAMDNQYIGGEKK